MVGIPRHGEDMMIPWHEQDTAIYVAIIDCFNTFYDCEKVFEIFDRRGVVQGLKWIKQLKYYLACW